MGVRRARAEALPQEDLQEKRGFAADGAISPVSQRPEQGHQDLGQLQPEAGPRVSLRAGGLVAGACPERVPKEGDGLGRCRASTVPGRRQPELPQRVIGKFQVVRAGS